MATLNEDAYQYGNSRKYNQKKEITITPFNEMMHKQIHGASPTQTENNTMTLQEMLTKGEWK